MAKNCCILYMKGVKRINLKISTTKKKKKKKKKEMLEKVAHIINR